MPGQGPIRDGMTLPQIIEGLSAIASEYDALLCDAWGVIHNGRELYPGAAEALQAFRRQAGPVIILTNAPRMASVIPGQLDHLGLPRDCYDGVVTSGEATREAVHQLAERPFFRIGPEEDDDMFEAVDVTFTDFEHAGAIFCTGPNDSERETPEDYRGLLTQAAARGLPMVCANPDLVVRFGDKTLYCAGAIGQLYEKLGGKVILGGKPYAPIYELAMAQLTQIKGQMPQRVLAVGDGLDTDIKGANLQGHDVVFVASGIFSDAARDKDGKMSAKLLEAALSSRQVHAAFAMEELAW
ncbi:MAG: TIGR01459 family HAD-type hydrolase [Pseudomonadota bacterium]